MASPFETPVEQVATLEYGEFEDQIRDKPIVILYPRHRSRGALLSMVMQYYGQHIIYYNLVDEQPLREWLASMINSAIFPVGFDQTRAALDHKAEPEDLAAAFGADLNALRSNPYILLLDQFDKLQFDKAADRFFRELPVHLNKVQIGINARLLGLHPWNDLVLAGQATVVGDETAMGGSTYGDDPALGQLEVFALSGGHVYIDGQPVTSWDGSLPRHLFYYFVDHPMITRDEIFAVFWPKMSVKEATNVFHVTKRKISERLGHELTNYSSGFYIHSPRLNIHYDAQLFEDAVDQAIEDEDNAPYLWYKAIQLYRDEYLPYINMPWVNERREALQHKYARALIGLGRFHRGLNELDAALGYLLRALREKPDWEDVHQDVMMIYSQQGRIDDAQRQYTQLTKTLQSMFGIKPSKDTIRLYEVITAV
ncbi:MAG: bacterial transcriptional activator domain-containing protein [Anaerolineae bacterium]|nr:bacterial transcriptional activator domain-containing protein [Anaerolineae bacterium]